MAVFRGIPLFIKKFCVVGLALVLTTVLTSLDIQAKTFYVSDTNLKANLRTGSSFERRIVAMLRSGTKVTLIREEGAWAEVALEDGRRGWILRSYLYDRPPWRVTAQKLAFENQSLEKQVSSLEHNHRDLLQEKIRLEADLEEKSQKLEELQKANDNMKHSYNIRWFLGGAGVVLIGWILGFWRGRLRRGRSSGRYRL